MHVWQSENMPNIDHYNQENPSQMKKKQRPPWV